MGVRFVLLPELSGPLCFLGLVDPVWNVCVSRRRRVAGPVLSVRRQARTTSFESLGAFGVAIIGQRNKLMTMETKHLFCFF